MEVILSSKPSVFDLVAAQNRKAAESTTKDAALAPLAAGYAERSRAKQPTDRPQSLRVVR